MRYFPELTFKLDDSLDKHMRIQEILGAITAEREAREKESHEAPPNPDDDAPIKP